MTVVHVAVHDAVNAITRKYRTYLPASVAPANASPGAAAVAAAHHVLVRLFPAQAATLDRSRAASLAAAGVTESSPSVSFGARVAAELLKRRADDGFNEAQFAYAAPRAGEPGVWVPVGAPPIVLPGLGSVTPWVLERGSQFHPAPPPALASEQYARDYDEVKTTGALRSPARTDEQRAIAQFWFGTPTGIWNSAARQALAAQPIDTSAAARVLALMYLAAADASIACWDAKYAFNFWRPMTAIRQGDRDGNDRTAPDGAWEPLAETHQHPEYPAGHTTNSAAMATVLIRIFGDTPGRDVVVTSAAASSYAAVTRRWTRFSQGVAEVIDGRVYAGFHYRTSGEVGAKLGHEVATYVVDRALGPLAGRD
jgi:hypothetical protein